MRGVPVVNDDPAVAPNGVTVLLIENEEVLTSSDFSYIVLRLITMILRIRMKIKSVRERLRSVAH
jgi:hypothetical protein